MLSSLISLVIVQTAFSALLEPPDGQVYIGAWYAHTLLILRLATNDSTPGAGDGDRPKLFNERMGWKSGVFQYAQNIPHGADVSD